MIALRITRHVSQVAAVATMITERVVELIAPTVPRHLNGSLAS